MQKLLAGPMSPNSYSEQWFRFTQALERLRKDWKDGFIVGTGKNAPYFSISQPWSSIKHTLGILRHQHVGGGIGCHSPACFVYRRSFAPLYSVV